MQPVDTSGIFSAITQQGALFAFMLLCLVVLVIAVKTLYSRNVDLGDKLQTAMTDATVGLNNNTNILNIISTQVGGLINARQS